MSIVKKIIAFLIILLLLSSCMSKRYVKKALQLEQAGMYKQATEMYYQSVLANSNNVEAKIGLKKIGQISLDEDLAKFMKFYNDDYKKEAVYKYLDCKDLFNKVLKVGVELDMPPRYNYYYQEVKKNYLEERYNDAYLFLEEEQFNNAEKIFNEILKIQPDYQDVKELKSTAHFEPVYRIAKELLKAEKNKQAYYKFREILKKQNYKDSKQLCNEALNKATLTIAVVEFKNKNKESGISRDLRASIQKKISETANPFIKLVDRENVDKILNEQLYALEQKVDPNLSAKAGKVLGAKVILTAEIINYKAYRGILKEQTKKAYLKERVVKKEGEKEVVSYKYHKTTYKEFSMKRSISYTFQYKLISAETGEILLTDAVSKKVSDGINYATFDGNKKNLVPGYWEKKKTDSTNDKVSDNVEEVRALNRKLKSRRVIKTLAQLNKELNVYFSKKVVAQIERYEKKRI